MGIPESLVGESTLTRTQLETLRSYLKVVKGEMLLREAAAQRSTGAVTIGSYYRTVQQAREKVRESMMTVLIGLWLGMLKAEEVRRLFDVMGKGTGELSEEDAERFVQVLRALVGKIVM